MQLLLLLCVVAGAFAVQDCPDNSHYNSCGTACPLTCKNYLNPPKVCVLMCVPGCHCDEGYVKDNDGRCVLPDDCSSNAVCGANQEYRECGTACPLTCDNYDNPPKICPAMCVSGCHCKDGYVKTRDGRCVRPENCPTGAEVNSCLMVPDPGMCRGYFPMFHYDATTGKCQEFIYGGCQGNGNRFATEEECLRKCSSTRQHVVQAGVCDLPIEEGPCYAYFTKYGYDKTTGQCKEFIYGGCGGNKNNFESIEECQRSCIVPDVKVWDSESDVCSLPFESGTGTDFVTRYGYNNALHACTRFVYTGEGGNGNNFHSLDECKRVCESA